MSRAEIAAIPPEELEPASATFCWLELTGPTLVLEEEPADGEEVGACAEEEDDFALTSDEDAGVAGVEAPSGLETTTSPAFGTASTRMLPLAIFASMSAPPWVALTFVQLLSFLILMVSG